MAPGACNPLGFTYFFFEAVFFAPPAAFFAGAAAFFAGAFLAVAIVTSPLSLHDC